MGNKNKARYEKSTAFGAAKGNSAIPENAY